MSEPARISLRVAPGSGQTAIVGPYAGGWKVRVAAPPEGGRANAAVVRLLAETLGISPDRVRLVGGRSARNKVVELHGLTRTAANAALARASGAP